jgi:hypothetical protein
VKVGFVPEYVEASKRWYTDLWEKNKMGSLIELIKKRKTISMDDKLIESLVTYNGDKIKVKKLLMVESVRRRIQ